VRLCWQWSSQFTVFSSGGVEKKDTNLFLELSKVRKIQTYYASQIFWMVFVLKL